MNSVTIIDDLRDDVELLTRSDRWLEEKRLSVAQRLTILLDDLKAINKAIHVKTRLQQTNKTAVRRWDRDRPIDEVIQVMSLPDAVSIINREASSMPVRSILQLKTWMLDGYDPACLKVS